MTVQEYIADIWRQYQEKRQNGKQPSRVIISPQLNAMIKDYHRSLGQLPDSQNDYIQSNSIFGLEIYIDDGGDCRVE